MIGVRAAAFYHVVISETDVYAFSTRQIKKNKSSPDKLVIIYSSSST